MKGARLQEYAVAGDRAEERGERNGRGGSNVEDPVTAGLSIPTFSALAPPSPDADADGVMDVCDNCLTTASADQDDSDGRPLCDWNGDCVLDGDGIRRIVDEMVGP